MSLKQQIESHISTVFMNTDHFAVDVTYKRDNVSHPLVAMVFPSLFGVATSFSTTTSEERTYQFEAATFCCLMPPKRGDRIVEDGKTYVVTAPSNAREWQYADEDQLLLQIHTVLQKVG